jgi:hypothetical protein
VRMVKSHVKICLQHGLSYYQKDYLERCFIAFLWLTYREQCVKFYIYPVFLYKYIPSGMNDSNIHRHQALERYSTQKLLKD